MRLKPFFSQSVLNSLRKALFLLAPLALLLPMTGTQAPPQCSGSFGGG